MYELKTVHFSTYCIFVLWDFRINTDYFPNELVGRSSCWRIAKFDVKWEIVLYLLVYIALIFINVSPQTLKVLTRR
jgi:hypothetical protein